MLGEEMLVRKSIWHALELYSKAVKCVRILIVYRIQKELPKVAKSKIDPYYRSFSPTTKSSCQPRMIIESQRAVLCAVD
jgi:hypothetical protein